MSISVRDSRLVRFSWLCFAAAAAVTGCAPSPPPADATRFPARIVSLVPAVTEMLFALGAGERVVGISSFDTYPPEALDRPRVGALIDPNLEKIFELNADLVITYGTQSMLTDRLGASGIRTFSFTSGSIDEMLESIEDLAREIGDPDAGTTLSAGIESSLREIRSRATGPAPRVLLAHSRDAGSIGGFYTEGRMSYLDEVIQIAGGQNVFGDTPATSFQPSLEEVLERAPEVIIEILPSSGGTPAGIRQRLADWNRLETLPAVRNGRVYLLAGDYLLLIGPRLPEVASRLAAVIHPEAMTWEIP